MGNALNILVAYQKIVVTDKIFVGRVEYGVVPCAVNVVPLSIQHYLVPCVGSTVRACSRYGDAGDIRLLAKEIECCCIALAHGISAAESAVQGGIRIFIIEKGAVQDNVVMKGFQLFVVRCALIKD